MLNEGGIEVNENLLVSRKAHLILPTHRLLDAVYEKAKGKNKIGSTLKGIGPTYTDKVSRNGLRIGDLDEQGFEERYNKSRNRHLDTVMLYDPYYEEVTIDGLPFLEYEAAWKNALEVVRRMHKINNEYYLNQALLDGKSILAEGAQGTLLDIDFGSYPFVTSSNTTTAGMCVGLGIAPNRVGKVYGIFKAYCTRVGSGPFPTELFDDDGQKLRDVGNEYGSTTGRPRRCGWLDLPALKYSIMLNGVDELMMMKTDVLNDFKTIKVATKYRIDGAETDELPGGGITQNLEGVFEEVPGWNSSLKGIREYDRFQQEVKDYVNFIEQYVGIPIRIVSIGPDRVQTVFK
jgi:adenylosuccinate synthase